MQVLLPRLLTEELYEKNNNNKRGTWPHYPLYLFERGGKPTHVICLIVLPHLQGCDNSVQSPLIIKLGMVLNKLAYCQIVAKKNQKDMSHNRGITQ